MSVPSCVPVIFGPGVTPHCPAVPWWDLSHVTAARLGWWLLAAVIASLAFTWAGERLRDRWERTCGRLRITRRWYGTGARVCIRDEETGDPGTARYEVLAWDDEHTRVPWLLLLRADGIPVTFRDDDGNVTPLGEDEDAFWVPVTACAPDDAMRTACTYGCDHGGREGAS